MVRVFASAIAGEFEDFFEVFTPLNVQAQDYLPICLDEVAFPMQWVLRFSPLQQLEIEEVLISIVNKLNQHFDGDFTISYSRIPPHEYFTVIILFDNSRV